MKWFGGNNKAAAEQNFIPLVRAAMEDPLTFEEALKIVVEKIDSSYQYWLKRKDIDPAFKALIIKMAKSYGGK